MDLLDERTQRDILTGSGAMAVAPHLSPSFLPVLTFSRSAHPYTLNARRSPTFPIGRAEGQARRQSAIQRPGHAPGRQSVQPVSTQSYGRIDIDDSLSISDTVLGDGSGGTRVFKGSFKGRVVAVKRMLSHLVTLVERELETLHKSDSHPNVIRYYYHTGDDNFKYIALELCPASLADIVERRAQFPDIAAVLEPKRALSEITAGLRHLHGLRIVHRDIKPQNILISDARGGYRMLVSDFGLCKQLEDDRMSYNPTAPGAGTAGWRAPEVLRGKGEVKLDGHGTGGRSSRASASGLTRQTPMVDIFSLGCLYYYVLTGGSHPFGAGIEVEFNILKDAKSLGRLKDMVAIDVIERMLSPKAEGRPDTTACLLHPFFWDAVKLLNFLQDASDHFQNAQKSLLRSLENGSEQVVGPSGDWCQAIHSSIMAHFKKKRGYDSKSVRDLLRLLRNAKHHFNELPGNVKKQLGTPPESFLRYFTEKFPRLFLHVYSVVSSSSLGTQTSFRTYFELKD